MRKLIYSALKTPDGTVIISLFEGDIMSYVDNNGEIYTIGWNTSSANEIEAEIIQIHTNDPINKIRECLYSLYVDPDDNLMSTVLKNIEDHDLEIIFNNEKNDDFKNIYKQEIEFRKNE